MSLAILVAVVSVFVMPSFLCECRVRWLKHACIHLPQGDEMNHTPYSAKFLPGTMLRCGAEVIRGNITYRVVGMVVITINDERWLLYRLQCPKIKRRVALGVNVRNGELHIRWWWGDGNYYSSHFRGKLSAYATKVVDFGGELYVRVASGRAPFTSLGSTGYPKQ
jgi:hypothetical protein